MEAASTGRGSFIIYRRDGEKRMHGKKGKLVKTHEGSFICIWYVTSEGRSEVCRAMVPCDGQINDDLELAESICKAIQRRIGRSMAM